MKRSRSNVRRLIADVLMCCLLIVTGIPMTAKADDAAGLQQSAPVSAETTENGEDAAQTPAATETAEGTAQAPASEDTQKTESAHEADKADEKSTEETTSAQDASLENKQNNDGAASAPDLAASEQKTDTDDSKEMTDVSDDSRKQGYTETYEFYDSDKTCVSSQTVRIGDTLAEPAVPKTLDGKTFTGWTDDSGVAFNSFGTVDDIAQDGAVIKLYANYADAIYIHYYDQYGNLIKSQPVEAGSTVTIEKDVPLIQVQPLTQCQDGWSTDKNGTNDVSGEFQVGTESVDLYPILKEGYWVKFETDSGTSISRQFIARNATGNDAKVNKPDPDPVKKGYVFDQWYVDPALKKPYDFNQPVTNPLTLYAGYKPAEDTEYTVKYWLEYQKEPGSGVGDGIWDYKLLTQEVIKGKTGDKAGFHTKLIFSSPYDVSDEQYELNTDLTTKNRYDPARPTIQADGSTVLNVYYRCKTYDLSAVVPLADGTTQKLSYTKVKYSSDLTNFWKAVFAIRPEQELFDGKHRFIFPEGSGVQFIETPAEMDKMPSEDVAMYLQTFGGDNSYFEQYLETLHGKAPDGKAVVRNKSRRGSADTRTYYLKKEDQFNSGTFGGTRVTASDFPGFTPFMECSDGNYYPYGGANADVWFRYPEELFQKYNPGMTYNIVKNEDGTQHMYNGANDPIRIYYTRNSYPLNFHTNGGPEVKNQSVLFEDDLSRYQPSNYSEGQTIKQSGAKRAMRLLSADSAMNGTTKKEGNEEFVFAGWYTDSALKNSFDFGGTMPAHEVDLYARWVPKTFTVSFDTGKGSAIDKIRDIPYGNAVARPKDPYYKDHIFLGWTLNGKPYDFSSGVTEDIVLKAEWRSVKAYHVTYNLNGGSGTAPKDKKSYYEDAGVMVASADGITAPEGKVFLGWKSGSDGRIYYPNGSAPMAMGGLTLTAQWGDKEKTAQLTYDFNFEKYGIKTDGNSSSTVSALKNNSSVQLAGIDALHAVPDGYVFKGWYLDKNCTDGPYTFLIVNSRKASCVYAKWEAVRHETPETSQSSSGSSTNVTGNTASPVSAVAAPETQQVQSAAQVQLPESENITKPAVPAQVPMQHTGNSKAPATGDTSHIELYFLVMTGCLAILVTDFMIRKRHDVRRR